MKWVAGLKNILIAAIALVVGLISLIMIPLSRQAAKDKQKVKDLEQQIKNREKIHEAIKNAPTNKEEALEYLKRRG